MPGILAAATLLLLLLTGSARAAVDDYPAAQQLHAQGQSAEALKRLERHLEANPRDARARFLMGVIFTEQKRTDEAIRAFTELTQEFPELPEPYNNLAVIYASRGHYARARELLEMSIRAHPGYATAHENLGDVYARLAGQEYAQATALDKTDTGVQRKRAIIAQLNLAPEPDAGAAAAGAASAPAASPSIAANEAAASSGNGTATRVPDRVEGRRLGATVESPAHGQDDTSRVLKTVEDWAAAWSRGEASTYLSFYARDFRPAGGESRAKWENARRERLTRGGGVTVTTSDARVSFPDADHAIVTFRQDYVSETLRRSGRKTLHLDRHGDRWLITRESIAKG